MKRSIPIFLFSLFLISIISCKKNNVEIVTQDSTYQLNAQYFKVDLPDTFKFDPSNIVYLSGQTNITLNGRTDGQTTIITDNVTSFPFKVKMKRALDKTVKVKLVADNTLLSEYTGVKTNYKELPADNFSISEAEIKPGSTEADLKFTLKSINTLNAPPGYLVPLRLDLVDPVEGLKVSGSIAYAVFVKINIAFDNIESTNIPFAGTLFNDIITFESNKSSGLQYLKDGLFASTWYPNNASIYLTAKLPQEETIKGIVINTVNTHYQVGSVKVSVEENGAFIGHGEFVTTERTTILYIKFKNPVTTKSIRFTDFYSLNKSSPDPDITELRLVR